MADNGILDELKKATETVQRIVEMEGKERTEYLDEVAKQFFGLQETVHSIISEEGIILKNFEWKWIKEERICYYNTDLFFSQKAKLFADQYGFSYEKVFNLLELKNESKYYYTRVDRTISYYMLVPKE